ncbi:hypothetical protein TKK_0012753 [Trichogramma kaykai]|uniref:Protein FMC1 homolog n=1 Tax=Trichogramma kaykai TaxID=54128 RepID=A0ABD2WLZ5_9HYME
MNPNVTLLRHLAHEIRHTTSTKVVKNNMLMNYIVEQSRSHKPTTEVLCKTKEELHNLGQNYLCYLNSLRKYNEINTYYNSKGERSIKETANLVGFKLPHDPR